MRFRSTLLGVALIALAGCGSTSIENLPELHPAKGTLTMNGEPVKEGAVQFGSESTRELSINGLVDANGKFELYTLSNGKRAPGAPAGKYTVTYMANSAARSTQPSINAPSEYTVEPGKTNEWTIELAEKK